jgi:hypothetical protein
LSRPDIKPSRHDVLDNESAHAEGQDEKTHRASDRPASDLGARSGTMNDKKSMDEVR